MSNIANFRQKLYSAITGITMKMRITKRLKYACYRQTSSAVATVPMTDEARAWLDVAPVGREFGSPDYERLAAVNSFEDIELRKNAEGRLKDGKEPIWVPPSDL